MTQYFNIHHLNPQARLLHQAAAILQNGGVIIYPTDSGYALGCLVGQKKALDRIRQIRQLNQHHNFTLMCRDLSEISTYAQVDNRVFRLLKAFTPGAYTFILKATTEVPKQLLHPARKTIGIRIPDHPVALGLLEILDQPLMTTTLILPGDTIPMIEPDAMRDILGKQVDLIIDGGYCGTEPTTIINLVNNTPEVIRKGRGDTHHFE